jgi:hypothetical protein
MGGGGGGGGSGSGGGGVMGGGPGSRSEFEDQPRERLATHLHGQNAAETAKTSPHPATLGAPLEYVKLARTKGAKLLRAYETRRRTFVFFSFFFSPSFSLFLLDLPCCRFF